MSDPTTTMRSVLLSRVLLAVKAYGFPVVMIVLALIPGDPLFFYTRHGGLGWILIWFCWPWVTFIAIKHIRRGKGETRKADLIMGVGLILFYSLATIPISLPAATNQSAIWGYSLSAMDFWKAVNFPLSLLLFLVD